MSTTNHRMPLPGGAVAVRVDDEFGRRYHFHGTPAVLTVADVEVLFADSIAGDGGRELHIYCANRHCDECDVRCDRDVGHPGDHARGQEHWGRR